MSRIFTAVMVFTVLICISTCIADEGAPDERMAQINALIIDRDYDTAARMLEDVVSEGDAEAEVLIRLARIYLLGEQPEDAIGVCERIMAAEPEGSPAWRKAHFLAADANIDMGDFAEADRLMRDQVAHLLSTVRKAELAQIYVDHANELFEPEDEDEAPNYDRARFYYEQALDLGMPEEEEWNLRHRIGQCWVKQSNWGQAAAVYRQLLDQTAGADIHPTVVFELARAELRQGNRVEARHLFRQLLRDDPDAEETPEAERLMPETFGGVTPEDDVMLLLSVHAMENFIENNRDHELAAQAALDIARAYQHRGRTAEAIEAVEDFLSRDWTSLTPEAREIAIEFRRTHPDVESDADAIDQLIRGRFSDAPTVALQNRLGAIDIHVSSNLAAQGRILLGELYASAQQYDDAREAWNDFLRQHPNDPNWTDIQRRLVDLDFSEARCLIEDEDWPGARRRLQAFLDAYPLDSRQAEGLYLLGVIEDEQENWEPALEIWSDLADKYPNTEQARRALMRSGEIAEQELSDIGRARELYRRAREQGHGGAQWSLSRLESDELVIETEHAFRSSETPMLHLTTRNIETIQCEAYAIDLETYFRTEHTLRGVEDLDIALIDPDVAWEYTVEDYEEFRLFETDLELPLEGSGAWAIRLATDELETTTLTLVTDLAIIAKASRNQVLVFAEDWAGEQPLGGATALLSDGNEIFAEVTTGDDGVALYEDVDELRDLSSLRVFAMSGNSVACSEIDLSSGQYVESRRPRGFIWSAKPVYQPGQIARLAGIIRFVEGGRYVFAEGDEWDVTLANSRGQTLLADSVTLDEFGMFEVACPIPPTAPLGQYTLSVCQEGQPTYSSTFEVSRYQVDEVQVSIDLERRVIVRGEPVRATISVRRYTGEPLAGENVTYQLPGDIRHTGTTDEKGDLEVDLPTDEIPALTGLTLTVNVPAYGLSQVAGVAVAETAIEATISTVRPVYLSNEPFEVSVRTADIEGDPAGVDASLRVMRVTDEGGESLVSEQSLSTDPETGRGSAQVAMERGGLHRIRIEGTDEQGRPFTAQATVTISAEDDEIRLRLLSDRDTFHVGEEGSLTVMNRTESSLALATWETERILRHEIIHLDHGRSTWTFPLTPDDSPTVTAALALIDGTELHTADHQITVENDLVISLEPEADVYEPGAEVTMRVTAHDPEGNPVSARMSLAMVDQALLARYPDRTEDITDIFYGSTRDNMMRTASSANFSYQGVMRQIASTLIQERVAEELRHDMFAMSQDTAGSFAYGGFAPPPAPGRPASVTAPAMEAGLAFGAGRAGFDDELMEFVPLTTEIRDVILSDPVLSGTISLGDIVSTRQAGEWYDIDGDGSMEYFARGSTVGPRTPRRQFAELAFFDPAVTTDENGEATVTIPMPDNTTQWQMVARGTTRDTIVGQGEGDLITRSDFYLSAQLPALATEGDHLQVPIRVHNLLDEDLDTQVRATVQTVDGEEIMEPVTRDLVATAGGHTEFPLEIPVDSPRDIVLLIAAESGSHGDAIERTLVVQPWGENVIDSRSGIASGDARIDLAMDRAAELIDPSLTIEVFPNWEDALLRPLLNQPRPGASSVASRTLVQIALLDYLTETEESEGLHTPARLALQGSIAQLISSQRSDGGWAWIGDGQSRLPTTAQALRALIGAQAHGIWVDQQVIERAVQYLQGQQRNLREGDLALRAELHHALAVAGRGDFAALHVLYRERNQLDVRSLALATLAFNVIDRPEIAGELASLLSSQFTPTDDPIIICWEVRTPILDGSSDNLEATALAVLALEATQGMTDQVEGGVRFLMERLSEPWRFSDRAAATVAFALTRFQTRVRPEAARLEIDVLVDGERVQEIRWAGAPEPVFIDVPTEDFNPQEVRVDLRVRGEGEFAYRATLSAFHPGIEPVNNDAQQGTVERHFIQAERRYEGREVPRGRSVVEDREDPPTNYATAVERGGEIIANVRFWQWRNHRPQAYLIVEEPIPTGTRVVEGSLSGNYANSEILPGVIRMYFDPERNWNGNCTYRLHGVVPGEYRTLPSTVVNLYGGEDPIRSNGDSLIVLRSDQENPDAYVLSPDELYHLGLWMAADERHAEALANLIELNDRWTLTRNAEREVALQILKSAIAIGSGGEMPNGTSREQAIVRFFEILHEHHPDVILTWDQTLEVADAYSRIDEHERAVQVLRGAAEASFLRDARVAGVLEEQGDQIASIEHLNNLIATYPDLEPVQSALFALAGAIELKAQEASDTSATGNAIRDALEEEGLTVADLHRMSLEHLERFLIDYPENPRVDEATVSLATLWIELENYQNTIELCEALRRRYPNSAQLDDAVYLQAYAHFLKREDTEALALCRDLAESEFPTPSGQRAASPNRPQADYITAQISHAQGHPAEAIEAYRRVENQFPDAAEAIAHFLRRDLSLPEITPHHISETATVDLTTRNLDEVHLRVFRVDLMTLTLLRRNLDEVVDINLAGITPSFDQMISVGESDDYRDFDTEVDLEVTEPGAYLVVAASDNLNASGLVLISDLEVEVQEDATSGRVRANVTDPDGQPVAEADVRVIGQHNERFTSGETDRRGIFIADGIQGTATVLVRSGDQFAFHRGQVALTTQPHGGVMAWNAPADQSLMSNVYMNNEGILASQSTILRDITVNTQEGVDLYRVRQ